ncbi:hypothetical protein TL16_g10623 [Triparma laevis f. inornata]|uniref:Peptidase C14 caspase domain-containing protein n=2 Tax=Triparma laevis TaxID=1534972 RepID=A0A9W7FTN0_9STRA|nr:hypothetical protein TL16_g10623 [Triparma laevis f. inornata]GMI18029.1 hypothetical protein TrLO_g3941 [Triparma laevis f. longispina]
MDEVSQYSMIATTLETMDIVLFYASKKNLAFCLAAWDDDASSMHPVKNLAGNLRLKAFRRDTQRMAEHLIAHRSFAPEDVTLINATADTKAEDIIKIFEGIQAVVDEARDESYLVTFSYSGHGTFSADYSGDELAQGEGPDAKSGGFGMFGRRRPPRNLDFGPTSSTLVLLLDCCHSGSMMDLKYKYVSSDGGKTYEPTKARKKAAEGAKGGKLVSVSACTDNQEAYFGPSEGNLTAALLNSWAAKGTTAPILQGGLFPKVREQVVDMTNGKQEPVLCSNFVFNKACNLFDCANWEQEKAE